MKTNFLAGMSAAGRRMFLAGLALAGLATTGQVAQAHQTKSASLKQEYKAALQTARKRRLNVVKHLDGLDLVQESGFRDYGMSPKEYGMRYGSRSKGGKTNRLRLAHNAKLNRRRAA